MWWRDAGCVACFVGLKMGNGIDILIDNLSNGTRADRYGTKGKGAGGLLIEGKLLARHL